MKQNINFLKSLQLKKSWFSFERMVFILGGILAIFFLISLYLGVSQWRASRSLKLSEYQLDTVQKQYQSLVEKYPLLAGDKPLIEQLTAFEEKLREQRQAFQNLTHATFRQGFSTFMLTLSKDMPPSMWLTHIDIDQDNGDIRLKGATLSAERISDLIAALGRSKAFSQVVFNLFYVKKIPNKAYLSFAIANHDLAQPTDENETNPEVVAKPPET